MKIHWRSIGANGWVLIALSALFAFCVFYDPSALRVSVLDIPLFYYASTLSLAAVLPFFGGAIRFIGYCLGAVTFSTFSIGLLQHLAFHSRAQTEASIASLTIYGGYAAFYWIEAHRVSKHLTSWRSEDDEGDN